MIPSLGLGFNLGEKWARTGGARGIGRGALGLLGFGRRGGGIGEAYGMAPLLSPGLRRQANTFWAYHSARDWAGVSGMWRAGAIGARAALPIGGAYAGTYVNPFTEGGSFGGTMANLGLMYGGYFGTGALRRAGIGGRLGMKRRIGQPLLRGMPGPTRRSMYGWL